MFLANYSDGLTDVDLDDMIDKFEKSGKLACFLRRKTASHLPPRRHRP